MKDADIRSRIRILEPLSRNSFTKYHGSVMLFLIQEGAQTARSLSDNPAGMTTPGWIFISIAWTAIITVVIFCYRKVIQKAFERRQRKSLESLSLREDVGDEKVNK